MGLRGRRKGTANSVINVLYLRDLNYLEVLRLKNEVNKLVGLVCLRTQAEMCGFQGNPASRVEAMLELEQHFDCVPPQEFALLALHYGMGYLLPECAEFLGWSTRKASYMLQRAHCSLLEIEFEKAVA